MRIVITLVLVAAMLAPGVAGSAGEPVTLAYSQLGLLAHLPWQVALGQKYFEEQGLEPKGYNFESGAKSIAALIGGRAGGHRGLPGGSAGGPPGGGGSRGAKGIGGGGGATQGAQTGGAAPGRRRRSAAAGGPPRPPPRPIQKGQGRGERPPRPAGPP